MDSSTLRVVVVILYSVLSIVGIRAAAAQCSLPPQPRSFHLGNCTTAEGVDSWGLLVGIGDSSVLQEVCLVPSTVVDSTLVQGVEVCSGDQNPNDTMPACRSRRGGLFNHSVSSFTTISLDQILAPDPAWAAFSPFPNFTVAGNSTLFFPSDLSIGDFPIGVITDGQNSSAGHLGLANNSVYLQLLVQGGLAPSMGFGLNVGSQSVALPRDGHLVIGGYDKSSVDGYFANYSMEEVFQTRRVCSNQVVIESLKLRRPGLDDVNISSEDHPIPACIEPYDTLFRLPNKTLQYFKDKTGWSASAVPDPGSLLVVEPGLWYPRDRKLNFSLVFKLNHDFEIEIPNEELVHPLGGIVQDWKRVLQDNITEVNISNQTALFDTAVLPRAFLSRVYLAIDYATNQFQLAKLVIDPVAPNLVPFSYSGIQCPPPSNNDLVIGISMKGNLLKVALLLIVFLAWYLIEGLDFTMLCALAALPLNIMMKLLTIWTIHTGDVQDRVSVRGMITGLGNRWSSAKIGIALPVLPFIAQTGRYLHSWCNTRRTTERSNIVLQLGEEQVTFANRFKGTVEDLTKERWDWWPFQPRFLRLDPGKCRIRWSCACGYIHWFEISKGALPSSELKHGTTLDFASLIESGSGSSDNGNDSSSSRSSLRNSSASALANGCSSFPDERTESRKGQNSCIGDKRGDGETTLDIIRPSRMEGFVLFAVHGAPRLQSGRLRLAHIDIREHPDDDRFFDVMAAKFKQLRGVFRSYFSIWTFHACIFSMIYKTNPDEIWPGPGGLPSKLNPDYVFESGRDPPIGEDVFNTNFYGCWHKTCLKSRIDVLRMFHECRGRKNCGHFKVLRYIPKRKRQWNISLDEETDEAWGIQATFGISFCRVALYHLLILSGPATFWGLWLRQWPTDWQNASVPLCTTVALVSLFWLPLLQNANPVPSIHSKELQVTPKQ